MKKNLKYLSHEIFNWFNQPSTDRKITIFLIFLSFFASIFTYLTFSNSIPFIKTTPIIAIAILSFDSILLLILCFKVVKRVIKTWRESKKGHAGSKISIKFILTFALIVLIPTLSLSIFSSLFFNIGMKAWFNDRILKISEQSNVVANAYLKEHKESIKSDALIMAQEIDNSFDVIFLDLNKLTVFINEQISNRELTEGFVFKKNGAVLAKAGFTISSVLDVITEYEMMEADSGNVIFISKRKDRVRALIKLKNIQNTYLTVGRFIDPQIINQIETVKEESLNYKKLYEQRSKIETTFYIVFIFITFLILLISILIGLLFADTLINPIKNLIATSNQIKSGNLSVRVPQTPGKDEMSLLIKTFNEMTEKLKIQRTELQKRERNAAWSDIARRIAHEIKNPLTPIQLSAEYLKTKTKSKEDKNYANTIIKKVSLIENMVDEFSKFARLPKPKFAKKNINDLCLDLILFHQKSNKNIKFSISKAKRSQILNIDELQMSMVITNLINNSIDSINELNDNKNRENYGQIKLSIYMKKRFLYINIVDNGKGLPENFSSNKILEPYITTKKKGTGLGLAIVLKIIQEHNGNFYINNNKNMNGTSALIELPKYI